MGEDDLEWMGALCSKSYPGDYDHETTRGWLINTVFRGPLLFYAIRSEDAFVIAMLAVTPWRPTCYECDVILACADEGEVWQLLRLIRCTIDWARRRNCDTWRLASDTLFDFRGIARRVGAIELSPRYVLRL